MGFIPLELSGPSAATLYSQGLMAFFFRKLPPEVCQAKNEQKLMFYTLSINDVIYIHCQEKNEPIFKKSCYKKYYAQKIDIKIAAY
jgi:hypothetical protein